MNKLLFATAAVALATVGTAGAADLPTKAPPMVAAAPVASWTGCWVSGGIGYGMSNTEATPKDAGTGVSLSNAAITEGGRGWLGRVGVGCDYQVAPSFVIGAFGDFDWSNIHGNYIDPFNLNLAGDEKLSRSVAAGGRIGYLPFANLLTFISGGWTRARVDGFTMTPLFAGGAGPLTIGAHDYNGWFIGGGTEYRLPFWQNFTWKTEYRFSEFRTDDLPLLTAAGAATGILENNQKFVQTVTTSLVWRFNFGGPVVARY